MLLVLGLRCRVVERLSPRDNGEDSKQAVPVIAVAVSQQIQVGTAGRENWEKKTNKVRASAIVARSFSIRIARSARALLPNRFELRAATAT